MIEKERTNLKSFILIFFVYYYPATLTFLLPFFVSRLHFEIDIFENFVFSSIIFIFSTLYLNKRIYILLMLFFLYLFAFIETIYLVLFKSYFTSSSIFIFFESNTSEISSFTKQYGSIKLYFITLSLLIIYLFFMFFLLKRKIVFSNFFLIKFKNNSVFKFLILSSFCTLFIPPLNKSFFPMVVASAFIDYNHEIAAYDAMKFKEKSNCFNDVLQKKDTINEVYVLVIGESTTRNHMGIYGYYRQTTPLLESISNELFVYKDVISPNTHTLTSLEKVLTLGTTENLDLKYQGNFLQLFNQAGFSTYWISNQNPTGIWNNFIAGIANSSEEKFFFNISNGKSPYDEVLLESFRKVLEEKKKKKLIVLHLMGTHLMYEDRYPKSFDKFKDNPITKFESETAKKAINSYDNAVLYQDYIWFSIIDLVKKANNKSAVLCISDHGEEVYEHIDFSGHTETKGTKSMYDIPFVLWLSEKKKREENSLIFDINRSYSTENLIFTMADLATLKFKKLDTSKSILNKESKFTKRIIFNNLTYDDFFKE